MKDNNPKDNTDVVIALVTITAVILTTLHFVQTGGLPAVLSRLF